MLIASVQPSIVSLFSSTGSAPLQLFRKEVDRSLPADSFIHLLHDQTSLPCPDPPGTLISPPPLHPFPSSPSPSDVQQQQQHSANTGYSLNQTVLQIQSPTLRKTYIHCPPSSTTSSGHPIPVSANRANDPWPHSSEDYYSLTPGFPPTTTAAPARDKSQDLGIRHPWMHVQVRNMGREWAFEVGIVDQSGRMGVVRFSTFQKQPRLRLSTSPSSYPLLHLPLAFPPPSSMPFTSWSTLALCLPSYLPYFSSSKLIDRRESSLSVEFDGPCSSEPDPQLAGVASSGDHPASPPSGSDASHVRKTRHDHHHFPAIHPIPAGRYSHLAYVRIYATCRLRRIWFDDSAPGGAAAQKLPWEFELHGDG